MVTDIKVRADGYYPRYERYIIESETEVSHAPTRSFEQSIPRLAVFQDVKQPCSVHTRVVNIFCLACVVLVSYTTRSHARATKNCSTIPCSKKRTLWDLRQKITKKKVVD